MIDSKDSRDMGSNNQSAEGQDNYFGDVEEEASPGTQPVANIFSMHDTPPPMMISDGSVFIDTDEDFRNGVSVGGGKQQHRRPPRGGKTRAYIHAIRVLLGNGATDDYFHPISDKVGCRIDIVLDDGTTMLIKGGPIFFIETQSNKPLVRFSDPKGRKRKHVFKYKDSANLDRTMKSISITDGAHTYNRTFDPSRVNSDQEFQLMIWVEDV